MPTHWTYQEYDVASDLEQGDLLDPTAELRAILGQVHQHFLDPKYLGFCILSQSCDLVMRKGQCSAPYISIAVIRTLRAVLNDLLASVCQSPRSGLFFQESKGRAVDLLSRLFNQNESALGLFYLYPDADVGIGEHAVVLLRISVTLRAEHYEILKAARRGRLDPEFRNKLGWLVGNLYSRIGTPDWSDQPGGDNAMKQMIKENLNSDDDATAPQWIARPQFENAKRAGVDVMGLPLTALTEALAHHKPPLVRDIVINEVGKVILQAVPWLGKDPTEFPMWEALINGRWCPCNAELAAFLSGGGHAVRLNPDLDNLPTIAALKQRMLNNTTIKAAVDRG